LEPIVLVFWHCHYQLQFVVGCYLFGQSRREQVMSPKANNWAIRSRDSLFCQRSHINAFSIQMPMHILDALEYKKSALS
jgi:hypothetical protein